MFVCFKFNEDGGIFVAKSFFKQISEDKFYEKCVLIDRDKFITGFTDKEVAKNLKEELKRIDEIKEMKLSKIGPKINYRSKDDYDIEGCYVGNLFYKKFYENEKWQGAAVKYASKFYEKEVIDRIINENVLLKPTKEEIEKVGEQLLNDPHYFVRFYSKDQIITSEKYFKLQDEIKALTNIRDAKNPLVRKMVVKKDNKKR